MPQHIMRDRFHILRDDVRPALDECVTFCDMREGECGARRGTVRNVRRERRQSKLRWSPGRADDLHKVAADFFVDVLYIWASCRIPDS